MRLRDLLGRLEAVFGRSLLALGQERGPARINLGPLGALLGRAWSFGLLEQSRERLQRSRSAPKGTQQVGGQALLRSIRNTRRVGT
eukprot:2612766-Pyramimonas_sp.AAC.1